MCYTSGTTGRPKGVLYSHRAIVLHSMAEGMADCIGLGTQRHGAADRPDVPRQRVGAAVQRDAVRLRPGVPRSASRCARACSSCWPASGSPSRPVCRPCGWRCSQELDAHPGTYDLSALRALVDRRQRGARRHDPRLPGAPRPARPACVGHDRDDAARHGVPSARRDARRGRWTSSSATARSRGRRCRSSRSGRAVNRGSCRGMARRWASSKCADRGSRRSTTTGDTDDPASPTMAGSGRATS